MKRGLVIGKFYPPHAGHRLLVQTAAALCEHVSVVVMAASVESIPLEQRVAWLREIHADDLNVVVTGIVDDVEIDFHDAAIWQAHVAARSGGAVLIADTDAFATAIWHARYLETYLPDLESLALGGRRLYLLTHPEDVPFAQDGVRDGEQVRDWMTAEFATRLDASGRYWDWLRGKSREARLERAIAMIDDWLASGLGLPPPLLPRSG